MNAHVKPSAFNYYTPQERALQALAAVEKKGGITAETVAQFHHLLGNIVLLAAHCCQLGNEIVEGVDACGDPVDVDGCAQKMLAELGDIKSNLIFIGSVIKGQK